MHSTVERFKIYNQSELTELSVLINKRLISWASAWLGSGSTSSVRAEVFNPYDCLRVNDNFSHPLIDDVELLCDNTIGCMRLIHSHRTIIIGKLFSCENLQLVDSECKATQKLLNKSIDELLNVFDFTQKSMIQTTLENNSNTPWLTRGKGWLYIELDIDELKIPVLLYPHNVQCYTDASVQEAKATFSRGKKTIANHKVKVLAELGNVSLSIGEFQSLKCGDILRLESLFSDKAIIKTENGEKVCSGRLGENSGKRAIKITDFY